MPGTGEGPPYGHLAVGAARGRSMGRGVAGSSRAAGCAAGGTSLVAERHPTRGQTPQIGPIAPPDPYVTLSVALTEDFA
jgi:hypothetical protein